MQLIQTNMLVFSLLQVEARKKYTEQPPDYLGVSKETFEEMDQKRLQDNLPGIAALTMDALEKHDMKHTTGPCQLRQFGCPICQYSWWKNVLKSKPVSRCMGGTCGNTQYDALPRDMEFGIGRCLCPKKSCARKFYAYCVASEIIKCRKCKSECKPQIHPKWRKRARSPHFATDDDEDMQYNVLSAFSDMDIGGGRGGRGGGGGGGGRRGGGGGGDSTGEARGAPHGRGGGGAGARKPRKEIFNASDIHVPSGGVVTTFLNQIDFEDERNATEVDLDYDSDDDDETVGVCKLECDCGNEFTVVMQMRNQAKCHQCGKINNPLRWEPLQGIQKTSHARHSCSLCNGQGHCPNLIAARLSQED